MAAKWCENEQMPRAMKSGALFTLVAVEYKEPRNYRQSVIKAARDNVFELIEQYDQELTKNSQEIIKNHHDLIIV